MAMFKELTSKPRSSNYTTQKPYVKLIKEDFKIVDKKAKAEIQKAYTKGYTPDYILDRDAKQPKFELQSDGILHFIHDK